MTSRLKPFKLYLISFLLAVLINSFLVWLVCIDFDSKSAICIYFYGGFGFAVKAPFFFLPYLFLKQEMKKGLQLFICWIPAIIFFLWFRSITFFQIESLYTELEFGYLMRFPHALLQLLSALICCFIAMVRVLLLRKKMSASQISE